MNRGVVGLVNLRVPILRSSVSAESRVNNWYDGKWNSGVRKSSAAGAALISTSNSEEVLVGDVVAMASRLDLSHHE